MSEAPHQSRTETPGEDAPLPMRAGGQPITDAEALGVWRRWIREQNEASGRQEDLPTELPLPNERGKTPLISFRVPRRAVLFARARAEMEGVSLTDVVRDFIEAYGRAEPGSVVQFAIPATSSTARRKAKTAH